MTINSADEAVSLHAESTCYTTYGVAVRHYQPRRATGRPPVVLVHGGNSASWAWDTYAPWLAHHGYPVHALDWYNHGNSVHLPTSAYLNRSILDIASDEIAHVVDGLGADPILVGASMGGLAAMAFAATRPVTRLALVASALPVQVRAAEIPVPVDFTAPFPPPPFEQAREMFFTTMVDQQAHELYALMEPESPRAVWETSRNTLWADLELALPTPTLVLAAELDALFAPAHEQALADLLGATYIQIPGVGHVDLLLRHGAWRDGAQALTTWLED